MIVCMSRRICVDLYNALIKLRSEWEAETLKVVTTRNAEDGPEWQKHIGNKQRRRELANQFKDANNPFKSQERTDPRRDLGVGRGAQHSIPFPPSHITPYAGGGASYGKPKYSNTAFNRS